MYYTFVQRFNLHIHNYVCVWTLSTISSMFSMKKRSCVTLFLGFWTNWILIGFNSVPYLIYDMYMYDQANKSFLKQILDFTLKCTSYTVFNVSVKTTGVFYTKFYYMYINFPYIYLHLIFRLSLLPPACMY